MRSSSLEFVYCKVFCFIFFGNLLPVEGYERMISYSRFPIRLIDVFKKSYEF